MVMEVSRELHKKIAKALGLGGQPIKRLVVVADAKDVVKVYVERYVEVDEADEIIKALEYDKPEIIFRS